MEQKKTIWITLSAGIFLLVVIGAAIVLYKDSAKNTSSKYLSDTGDIFVTSNPVTLSSQETQNRYSQGFVSNNNEKDHVEYIEDNDYIDGENTDSLEAPASQVQEDNDSVKLTPASQESNAAIADNITVIASGATNIYPSGTTTIDLTSSSQISNVTAQNQAAQNAINQTQKIKEESSSSPKNSAPVSVSTASKSSSTAATKPSASTTNSTQTASSKSSAQNKTSSAGQKTPDRYWVQAASYTSVKNAEEARSILDANKIQCEVFTFKDDKGTLYYRVRVGPYTTKSEAEYWKNKIDSIDIFAKNNTYITNSSASR